LYSSGEGQRTVKTTAIFFPFDLFGSGGAGAGARLLADAFREMLADNRREKQPTRARAYQSSVRLRELVFDTLQDFQDWRRLGRQAVRQAWRGDQFLLWIAGNHLGVLPVYDELCSTGGRTLVVQLDAHLDIYNLSDSTRELSHGNWLLHCAGPVPWIINVGHREQLLHPEHVANYYQDTIAAADLAVDPAPALRRLRQAARKAKRLVIDIDCDCLDPAFFPAVSQPEPFGLTPQLLLRILDAVWSERVVAVALSEFDPARDHNDQALALLIWLVEFLLLKRYE
jgi:arginase family enzyme